MSPYIRKWHSFLCAPGHDPFPSALSYSSAPLVIIIVERLLTSTSNDGGVEFTLLGGTVPGVLAEADGDPSSGFTARDEYVTDPSELGPLLDGEYYTLAPDTWGSDNIHNTADGDPATVDQFVKDLDIVLNSNNSVSLYVRPEIAYHSPYANTKLR